MKKKLISIAVSGIVVVALVGIVVPATRRSNCGGNSAALFVCGEFVAIPRETAEGKGGVLDFNMKPGEEKKSLGYLAKNNEIPGASFLVKRGRHEIEEGQKQIIVVCATAYSNVPQPTLWNLYKRTPAHAVGYSDGLAELISPAQFNSLNLSDFVDARELISTN